MTTIKGPIIFVLTDPILVTALVSNGSGTEFPSTTSGYDCIS
ncbi:MAG TPA: hypothetical protein VIS47_07305 [Nitrosopumilus sp.]